MRIYPRTFAIFVVCFMAISWLWLSLFSSSNDMQQNMLEVVDLRRRLHLSDTLNQNKERELRTMQAKLELVIQELNNSNISGARWPPEYDWKTALSGIGRLNESLKLLRLPELDVTDMQPPSIYHYLPHLIGNRRALKPAFKLSQKRKKVSLVFGVPTIKRSKQEYLVDTIRSLLENVNTEEGRDALIVVIVAEPWDLDYVKQVAAKLQTNFKGALAEGILEVIAPPADFYPDLNNLKENFGDSKDRVKWRTKQNLDFAFLMMYCRDRGDYYIQLEDDIITKPGYVSAIRSFAQEQQGQEWILLEFSRLGFIGKLFRTSDLSMIAEFFLMFHKDKPIDWLLDHILYVKACNPEKDNKHCSRSKQELKKIFKPSLFQHTGLHSSLTGKTQKLKDKDFGKGQLHRAHVNPAAKCETSLKVYQSYHLERAYGGQTFFWALLPQANDYVNFVFKVPTDVESYLFKSGNLEHTLDKFFNTSVDLLPAATPSLNETEKLLYPIVTGNYFQVGRFNEAGVAEAPVSKNFGKLSAIRLTVHSESENWVILSEIFIKQRQATKR